MGLQAGLANQQTGLQAGLANQQTGFQSGALGAQLGLQASMANQQMQNAALQRQLAGLTTQYQGGLQGALQGQQLGMQARQFGANLGQQAQVSQEQLRQAQQGANRADWLAQADVTGRMANQYSVDFANQLASQQAYNTQLQQAGQSQQQYEQSRRDAQYQDWLRQQMFPYQQLSWYQGLLSGRPQQGQVTQTGTQTMPGPSPFSQVMGAGLAAAGIFSGFGGAKGLLGGGA
jgi:hypothetical protein